MAESFGNRDEPVDTLLESLLSVGAEVGCASLRVKEVPGQQTYQLFEEAGEEDRCTCLLALLPSFPSHALPPLTSISFWLSC